MPWSAPLLEKILVIRLVIIPVSLAAHYALDSFRHGDYMDENSKIKSTGGKLRWIYFLGFLIILIYIYFRNSDLPEIENI